MGFLGVETTPEEPADPDDTFANVDAGFAKWLTLRGKQRWGLKEPRMTHFGDLFARGYPEAKFDFKPLGGASGGRRCAVELSSRSF